LFSLRHVPEDEAEEIRELLSRNNIEFYETQAGGWGISTPAIWLYDGAHEAEARQLIDEYQQQRSLRARAEYQALRQAGEHRTVADKIRENPLQALLFALLTTFILYVSLSPFLNFLK